MNKQMNFDIDEATEKRLEEIARATGINNNAGTIRYLINTTWLQMIAPLQTSQELTVEQDLKRRQ